MAKRDSDGIIPNPVNRKLAESVSQTLQPAESLKAGATTRATQRRPRRTIERKTYLHDAESRACDHVVDQIGDAVGIRRLPWSVVNRALWSILLKSISNAGPVLETCRPLERPASGDSIASEEFEAELEQLLRRILHQGFR